MGIDHFLRLAEEHAVTVSKKSQTMESMALRRSRMTNGSQQQTMTASDDKTSPMVW